MCLWMSEGCWGFGLGSWCPGRGQWGICPERVTGFRSGEYPVAECSHPGRGSDSELAGFRWSNILALLSA
jgi:hypothetical protein